jgi:sporulation protein YlmC with PRC-barrel domain
MIKYQDILGKTAYSLEEGRQWGRVTELFVDRNKYAVTAMAIAGGEERGMLLSSAKNIDESVIFQSSQDLIDIPTVEKGNTRGMKITGLKVMTESGNELGTVVSFYFKRDTGEITHYEISKSVLKENLLMSQEGLVRMGEDAMIITDDAAEVAAEMKSKDNLRKTIAELGKKAEDFAKGAKNAADKYGPKMREYGEKVNQGMSAAGTRAQEISDKYGPKIKEGAQKAEAKFKEAADKYGPKIKEAGDKAKDAVKKAIDKFKNKPKQD